MNKSAHSRSLNWTIVLSYSAAIISAATVVFTVDVYSRWGADAAALLFISVVMLVALTAGPGPTALASSLIFLALQFPLLSSGNRFAIQSGEILLPGLFVLASMLAVMLSAARRRGLASFYFPDDDEQTINELRDQYEVLRSESIEQREAATRALLAEQELRITFDTVPALIARYDPHGFMDFRNRAWREYTGLSQGNLEGRRWGSALHPDDEHMVEREWREHIATGEPFELEQRLRRADGEFRWHRVSRVPLRGERGEIIKWYAIAIDIHDRKNTDDALKKSETDLAKARLELQLMIDTIPVLVLRHRADGIIDFVNEVGRTYSGLKTTKWTSRTSIITHPDDVPRLEAAWDAALRTAEPFESEVRLRRADGQYRWFATRRVPLRKNGEVIAWYAATYDIEDRKRAESELIESERRLREAHVELAHASRVVTMGQFTASIAHEINQPLAALLANADTALRWLGHQPPNVEKATALIERVANDGKRAVEIIARIRDLSRKAPARKERLEVNETILEIMKLTRAVTSDKGVSIKMQLSEALPQILGDKIQIQQVIMNLIMNSVEAMSEDGQKSRELQISTSATESNSVLVAISDSGPGLPTTKPERIFDAFYTTKSNGLGIGLSICRSIVEAHGGRLWAKPNEPRGAVFSITLPTDGNTFETPASLDI